MKINEKYENAEENSLAMVMFVANVQWLKAGVSVMSAA
jgi:hypothetical protein